MKPTPSNEVADSAVQMEKVRSLILGPDDQRIKKVMHDNARELVGSVVIEALHDRQKQDDGLSSVLVPLVEKSVEKSVKSHSDQFVGYLYPLVGRLVRKSVTAFISEFLEKTNQLIENSLTLKGLGWRFKAWQAGVSFSQYVASQTFVYRVEQVLLIHLETGILLNTVSNDSHRGADADMVSGMLTAINDFVSDSFQRDEPGHEQNLDVIKTEDFSLLIKRGPKIMLVAAVTGNVPQHISTKLQLTLEQIHSLYAEEISQFEGDTLPFEATRSHLQECLVAELKDESSATKRKPWMAIMLVLSALAVALFFTFKEVQQYLLAEKLRLIDEQPGILVRQLHTHGQSTVQLHLLRDPNAIEVQQWLDEHQIESDQVEVEERAYLSLEPELVLLRIKELVSRYPDISMEITPQGPALNGSLNNANRQMLVRQLYNIPGIENLSQLVENIQVQELQTLTEDSPEILQALFQINSAKIDVTQIEFEQGKSELTKLAKQQISILSEQLKTIIDISQKLELNVGLIIMGASDSVGSKVYNQRLSLQRAQAVQAYLVELGIEPGYLNAIGLGVVEIQAVGSGARKVIFNIVDFKTQ